MVHWPATMAKVRLSEWLWRFLASAMLLAVGWVLWIFYQLNPPALVTNAAYEAAASANARQNAHGMIAPATPPAGAEGAPARPEPPINADKLRLSDQLSKPAR